MASHVIGPLMTNSDLLPDGALAHLLALDREDWSLNLFTLGAMRMGKQNGADVVGGTLFLTPGDDFVYTATLTDDEGEAYSLNGCTLWFTVKKRHSDADADAIAKAYWESGGGSSNMTVFSPVDGEFTVRFAPDVTLQFSKQTHVWDLQTQDTSGIIGTIAKGTVVIDLGVTNRTTTP